MTFRLPAKQNDLIQHLTWWQALSSTKLPSLEFYAFLMWAVYLWSKKKLNLTI